MKDSGIEWIGEIPKEWDLIKCKYVTEVYTGNSIKDEEKGLYEDPVDSIPYISTKDIDATFNSVAYDNGLFIKKIDTSFVRANKGDTLMCIEGGSAGRKKAILDRTVCFVNKLCCFHPTRINPVYLFYILNSPHYEEEFSVNMSGLIGGVSKGKLMNFILPYPCYDTQHRIADYLDDKCRKIDRYIEQQKQVIEKLKAYKQSVITEAVTKGLDPTVPMNDSGVEWIGEIPEGWTIVKLGHIFSYLGGFAYNSNLYTDESDYQVVRIGNVKNYRLVLESNPVYISESTAKETSRYKLQSNTILFTMTGTKGKRDYFFTYLLTDNDVANKNLFLNQRVGCLIPTDDICPKYFDYLLKDNRILDSVFLYETGTANQGNLGIDSIKRTILQFPPVSEQRQIADFLDSKCSSIDAAIAEKQNLIEKLTEYKKSLIYEVVTGKKEV